MEALEFARELKRMCVSHESCKDCTASQYTICSVRELEQILPIVERWSAEHPKVTNLDHYAEELEKIGYKVDREYLRKRCPIYKCSYFTKDKRQCNVTCTDCQKWWDEEYEGGKE